MQTFLTVFPKESFRFGRHAVQNTISVFLCHSCTLGGELGVDEVPHPLGRSVDDLDDFWIY